MFPLPEICLLRELNGPMAGCTLQYIGLLMVIVAIAEGSYPSKHSRANACEVIVTVTMPPVEEFCQQSYLTCIFEEKREKNEKSLFRSSVLTVYLNKYAGNKPGVCTHDKWDPILTISTKKKQDFKNAFDHKVEYLHNYKFNHGRMEGVKWVEREHKLTAKFTIHNTRREETDLWCYRCGWNFTHFNGTRSTCFTDSVQPSSKSTEGLDSKCKTKEGKCYLHDILKDAGYSYWRDCFNCSCDGQHRKFVCINDCPECRDLYYNQSKHAACCPVPRSECADTHSDDGAFSPAWIMVASVAGTLVAVTLIYCMCVCCCGSCGHGQLEPGDSSSMTVIRVKRSTLRRAERVSNRSRASSNMSSMSKESYMTHMSNMSQMSKNSRDQRPYYPENSNSADYRRKSRGSPHDNERGNSDFSKPFKNAPSSSHNQKRGSSDNQNQPDPRGGYHQTSVDHGTKFQGSPKNMERSNSDASRRFKNATPNQTKGSGSSRKSYY